MALVDVTMGNYNIYNPCGTDFDALSIGYDSGQYNGVDVDDWEYSLDGGTTWLPYTADEYATAPPTPQFGGLSYYVLTLGAPIVHFRALDVNGDDYFGSIAMPADLASCAENPDYTAIVVGAGGTITDGPGLSSDAFAIPAAFLPATDFFNESIAAQRADGTWMSITPDTLMTLADLGYTDESVSGGAAFLLPLKRSGAGPGNFRADLDGQQFMNQAVINSGIDVINDISWGPAHIVFVNAQPAATDDSGVSNGETIALAVTTNDSAVPGTTITSIALLDAGSPVTTYTNVAGTYVVVGLTVEFTPTPGFSGPAPAVPYRLTDSAGLTAEADIRFVVNLPRVAVDDTATSSGEPVTIPVTLNDSAQPGATIDSITLLDPDGEPTPTLTTAEGTFTVVGLTVEFTPAPGYSGTTPPAPYRITDSNGLTDDATITVTVTAQTTDPAETTLPADTTLPTSVPPTTPGTVPEGELVATGTSIVVPLVLGAAALGAGLALVSLGTRRRAS